MWKGTSSHEGLKDSPTHSILPPLHTREPPTHAVGENTHGIITFAFYILIFLIILKRN